MKQIFCKTIACCAAVLLLAACDKSDDLTGGVPGSDSIFLDFSSGVPRAPKASGTSRVSGTSGTPKASRVPGAAGMSGAPDATSRSAGTEKENRTDHIDVLIFDEEGAKKHYERIETGSATTGGTEALSAKRSSFTAGAKYWVYLVANANDDEKTAFEATDFDRDALKAMKREDYYLHLTGLTSVTGSASIPEAFLMDGVAYPGAETDEPATARPVVLNNGNLHDDTWLKVTLRRAAAKLVLKIKRGERITFSDYSSETGSTSIGGYYLRNMPYSTFVLGGMGCEDVQVRTTQQSRTSLYEWTPDLITVTAYVYAHNWTSDSAMEREPRWIVDIPMGYRQSATAEPKFYDHSYYQIPVCNGTELQRNTCYTVAVTLEVPGGTSPSKPVKLEELSYEVENWTDKSISVGGEDERPIFLTLNRDTMEMHNIDTDDKTLQFASSSKVTAEINVIEENGQRRPQVYYYNKFGVKTYVSNEILNEIKLTPALGLNGGITIESPVPNYKDTPKPGDNTIRYIQIKVKNTDGIERIVLIKQYPLEYITNIQGWYSYRSDFLLNKDDENSVTTYELLNGVDVKGKTYSKDTNPFPGETEDWKCGCTLNASTWAYGPKETGFFGSKVAGDVVETGNNKGKAYIFFYRWTRNTEEISTIVGYETVKEWQKKWTGWRYEWVEVEVEKPIYEYTYNYTYSVNPAQYVWDTYANPRMYHVRLTASSGNYTLGRPRIINGITAPGADNAKLVSPSFMIASQLGAVQPSNNKEAAAEHCKYYVEVYKDQVTNTTIHLKGWRLPTEAEIKIIVDFQTTSDAMDTVLSGAWYWSASGSVENKNGSDGSKDNAYIRCIRDAYDDPTTGKSAEPEAGNQ